MQNPKYKIQYTIYILVFFLATPFFVSAATGTINSTYKYAWSNNLGWINFAPTSDGGTTYNGAVITDTNITGYVWSPNYGWISLNCSNGGGSCIPSWGISNTTAGVLSGYAWGQSTGWIDFSGVSIKSNGEFRGTATGDVAGDIVFSCLTNASCKVVTDWSPSVSSCGDGICNGDDTCDTCSADCGVCPIPGTEYKNVCNAQRQCVSVPGSEPDECQTNSDCCDSHGDINKDGSINITDFSILMYFWQQVNPSNPCADINKDGTVNLTDFSIMLYWWTG